MHWRTATALPRTNRLVRQEYVRHRNPVYLLLAARFPGKKTLTRQMIMTCSGAYWGIYVLSGIVCQEKEHKTQRTVQKCLVLYEMTPHLTWKKSLIPPLSS